MDLKKDVQGKTLFREFSFTRESVNVENRTVELAFSSETPYERWFGLEILDHSPGSIRLDRLRDGGPLLLNHDTDQQIGVVESVEIGSDRVGRAVVRFGKGELADEIFNDVVDGIRRKVSVGYIPHDMILEGKNDTMSTYRVKDWEPLEVSIVPVPADNSVGVGRGIDEIIIEQEKRSLEKMPVEPEVTAANPAQTVNVREIEDAARAKERLRVREIAATGDVFKDKGGEALAREYIDGGKSVEEFNAAMIERAGKQKPQSAEVGLTQKEVKQFSFLRAVNALANPNDRQAREAAAFEFEVSEAASKKSGKSATGLMVPVDVLRAPVMNRDLVVGTSTAGGHTVATDLLAGSFIEVLRKKMVIQRMGARVLNGLVGNIAIPRATGAATAYWVAESGAPTESQQAFDQVTMSPKTVGAYVDVSRKLLIQSSIDVEAFVRDDLARVLALELDRVALYGTGSANQPLGLKGTTNLNTKDFAAMAPTYAEIVALETEIAADNADIGTMMYLMNARGRGSLKTTEKASSTAQFIWEQGGTVNGYGVEVSNQVEGNGSTTEDYWFGNWSDLILGFWSGLDLTVDPFSLSTSGTVRIVGLQDADIAVRHPESFCRGANTL